MSKTLAQDIDDLFDAQVPVEESRGYDDEPMSSDLAEVVGRLTPSPATDVDWGKSPRQLEREAEAEKEALPAVKGSLITELLPPDLAFNDCQTGDAESDRAYQAELAAEAAEAARDPDAPEFPAEMHQEAQRTIEESAGKLSAYETETAAELAMVEQEVAQLQREATQIEKAFAEAQQAGDQARMQQCRQAALDLQQRHAQAEQIRQNRELGRDIGNYVHQVESEFRQRRPDYDRAFSFLEGKLDIACRAQYPDLNAEQRAHVAQVAQAAFAADCKRLGIDMAQALYEKAAELGYQPAGKPRAPAYVPPAPAPMPSLSQIAAMDPGEFERWFAAFAEQNAELPGSW